VISIFGELLNKPMSMGKLRNSGELRLAKGVLLT